MASSVDIDETSVETLSSIFNQGLELYNKVNNTTEPTNTLSMQLEVKAAMKHFENATRLVTFTGMFSRNEGIEEIATNDLQYLLLPALLGTLSLKLTRGERKNIVNVAETYFKDFLKRCNDYSLSNYKFKEDDKKETRVDGEPNASFDDNQACKHDQFELATYIKRRAHKIKRFNEQKELKAKLNGLKMNLENEHADEGIKRDYFIAMIKSVIHEAVDELASIDLEKPLLEYMAKMKKDEKPPVVKRPTPPLKPVIITRDALQKAVFGAGYPGLPTMTVQEFYEKRVRDGIFPDSAKKPVLSLQQAARQGVGLHQDDVEAEAKEKREEQGDEEHVERVRKMDEFKDEHRRGWGNRMNRS